MQNISIPSPTKRELPDEGRPVIHRPRKRTRVSTWSHPGASRRTEADADRGQGSVEYVGIVIVVLVLVGVLVGVAGRSTAIGESLTSAVCEALGGNNCGAGSPDTAGSETAQEDSDQPDAGGARGGQPNQENDNGARDPVHYSNASGVENPIDAIVARMSDEELERFVVLLEEGWKPGWMFRLPLVSPEQVREFFLSRSSKETIDRVAQFTDVLEPSFDEVGGDGARDNPESVANTAQYGEMTHELFIDGVDPRDVGQGLLGDCWWIASIMAVAHANPSIIEDAITANPNGSYTVRLYEDGKPVNVTVTPEMVLKPDGTPAFVGNDRSTDMYELWPMVLEKALALHYGDFDDIEGGTADVGLTALTGLPSANTDPGVLSIADLHDVLADGGAIGLSSLTVANQADSPLYSTDVPSQERLRAAHAYYVSEVDVEAGTVTVVNPWGISSMPPITLTYDEFVSGFRQVRTNEVSR